jgi:hypothetical protein
LAFASGAPRIDDDVSSTNTISRGVIATGAVSRGGCAIRMKLPGPLSR